MATIEASIRKLLSDYIHSTKTEELHRRLDTLVQRWSRSKIVTPSTINPLKTLSRVHGLPKSFKDLFFTPLWDKSGSGDPEELRLAIKIIHCTKYALKHDKSFMDIPSLLSILKSRLKLEDFRRFNEPLCKELLSQFLVTISSLLSPERVKSEKCDEVELQQLQRYVPYVEGKYRSLIQADLERAGYWSNANNNVNTNSGTSPLGGGSGLSVRDGETLISSFHEKSIASKSGGKVTAHAVKSQQTEAITTEENVSEKTRLQNISLANALNESRAKSKTEEKNFEAVIKPATEREEGSDRWWYRTTSTEVTEFLKFAQRGRRIKEEDIVYLREKFQGGFKMSFSQGHRTMMNMIAETFALISQAQYLDTKLGKTIEAKGTTSAILLEGILVEKMDKPKWDNCRINILTAVEYDCIRNEVVPDKVGELLLKLRESLSCTDEMKNIIWGILSSDDEHFDQNFSEALTNVESVEQCSRALEFIKKQTVGRQNCTKVLEKFPTVLNVLLSVITGMTFLIEQKRVAMEAIENVLTFDFAPKLTPSQLQSLVRYSSNRKHNTRTASILNLLYKVIKEREKARKEGRLSKRLEDTEFWSLSTLRSVAGVLNPLGIIIRSNFEPDVATSVGGESSTLNPQTRYREAIEADVKKALEGNVDVNENLLEEYELVTGGLLRCIVTSLGKSESVPETFNQVPEDVWNHLVTAGLDHPDPDIQIFVLASMARWVSLPSISESIVKRLVSQETLAGKLKTRDIIYPNGRITLEKDLPEDFDFQDVGNDSDEDGGDQRKFTFVSEIVARILVASVNAQKRAPEASLPAVSEALVTTSDKATKILCSEYLFLTARFGQDLPPLVLNHLLDMTRDPVGDVRVYSKAAYCMSFGNYYGRSTIGESEEKLSTLVDLYSLKRTMLGEEDFTEWTNVQILTAFRGYSKHSSLPETAFQVLTLALNRASTESSEPTNNGIIKVVLETIQNSAGTCSNEDGATSNLPNYCIEAVESLLLANDEFDETCAGVLEHCIQGGRWVSDAVLEEFAKYLFNPSDESSPYIRRLYMANENQELPDQIFEEMLVELLGLRLHEVAGAPAPIQVLGSASDGDSLALLSSLRSFLSRGRALSPLSMEGIAKCLQKGIHPPELVPCLTLASSNGQSLSKQVIELGLNNREGELDATLKSELATALVRRNQGLPGSYLTSVFISVEACRDNQMPEASLLSAMIQHNHAIPTSVTVAFSQFILRICNDANFSLEYLSALIRVLDTQSPNEELLETMKSVFTAVAKRSGLVYQTLARIGLQKLNIGVKEPSNGKRDVGCNELTDQEFLSGIISRLRSVYETMPEEATGMSIPNKRRLADLLALHEKAIALLSAELLNVFRPGAQCQLFGDITDVVGQVLCETKAPRIIQICQAVLDKWVDAGILLGSNCSEMLNTGTSPLDQKPWRRSILDRDKSNRTGEMRGTSFGDELITAAKAFIRSSRTGELEDLVSSAKIQDPEYRLKAYEMVRILMTAAEGTAWLTIPNVVQPVAIYIMESGPDQVPPGLTTLLEESIDNGDENILPVVTAYLIGIRDKKIVPNSERALMTIGTRYLEELSWQMGVETLKCLLCNSFNAEVGRILIDSLKSQYAPVRSLAFTLLSANRDSISKVKELEEELSAVTRDVLDKVYDIIYKGRAPEDQAFDQGLLLTLHSLTHWDILRLKDVKDRSQWFRALTISDFLTRLSNSLDETVQLVSSASKMYDACERNPLIFAFLTELLCRRESKHLLGILQRLTYDEILNLLRVDENRWSDEVLEFGLSKLVREKHKALSGESSMFLTKKLLRVLANPQLAVDLVSTISTLDNDFVFEEFLIFLESEGSKNVIASLKQILKKIISHGGAMSLMNIRVSLEKQIFLQHIPSEGCYKEEMEELLRTLLEKGFNFDELRRLLLVRSPASGEEIRALDGARAKAIYQVLYQLAEYGVEPNILPEVLENIKGLESYQWGAAASRIILRSVFCGSRGEKTVEEVVAEFGEGNSLPTEGVTSLIQTVRSEDSPVASWTSADVSKWARRFKERKLVDINEVVLTEMLAVAKRAFQLHRGFRLTAIQTLACYTALKTSDVKKGMLQQVVTGSGKSTIIAIIALVKALQGIPVDVYTSSPVLAQRDSEEWSRFFGMFGLTCDHNADTGSGYTRGEKTCYKKNIVYGETSQFQFDTLRDEYSGLGTRAGRGYGFAIVDEVDSMLIDDSSKLARLSSTIAGMDLVQTLYHLAWQRLMDIQNRVLAVGENMFYLAGKRSGATYHYADENENIRRINNVVIYIMQNERNLPALQKAKIQPIDDIETFVHDLMTEYFNCLIEDSKDPNDQARVPLPPNLQAFARSQINNWVESALTALTFQENVHYIVDDGLIKPVDFSTTGIVQASTNWNNGLHQFLQIKHSLKITTETVTTNFLSNMAVFGKYGHHLLGFTGTLGSEFGKSILEEVYNIQTVTIPELYFKRFHKLVDHVVDSEEQWLSKIVSSCLSETAKKRGVLVICQTIKQSKRLETELNKHSRELTVKLYIRNDQNQERHVERIRPGDVIVATNLAGRGTDIKTPDIEDYGGMHVVLTFLPDSLRVEEQAFGRTSRQGSQGTGQLIVRDMDSTRIEELIQTRDEMEIAKLEDFSKKQLPSILVKDELFQKFSKIFLKIRNHLVENPIDNYTVTVVAKKVVGMETLTPLEHIVLQAVEERWALFLKRIDDDQLNADKARQEYTSFEASIQQDRANFRALISSTKNPFYWIQFANEHFRRKTAAAECARYYQDAIDIDSRSSAGAIAGKANLLLRGESCWYQLSNDYEGNYKLEAIRIYREAIKLLYQDIGILSSVQTLLSQRTQSTASELFIQLTTKTNLLGTYVRKLESNIASVEKSLRQVHSCGTSEDENTQNTVVVPGKYIPNSGYSEYSLMFHDLTAKKDMDLSAVDYSLSDDQAVKTVNNNSSYLSSSSNVGVRLERQNLNKVLTAVQDNCKNVSMELELLSIPDLKSCIEVISELELKSFEIGISGNVQDLQSCCRARLPDEALGKVFIKYRDPSVESFCSWRKVSPVPSSNEYICKIENLVPENVSQLELVLEISGDDAIRALEILQELCKENEDRLAFSLTTTKISPRSVIEKWENCLQNFNNNAFSFLKMNKSEAIPIIQILRKEGVEFILEFHDLKPDKAQSTLEKADREEEHIKVMEQKEMQDEFSSDLLPIDELRELSQRGICLLVTFAEKNFIPWKSVICMGIIATTQIAVGSALICTGFGATVGMGLVTEGFADFVVAGTAYTSRNFDWSSYAKQKAVSLTISAVSMGWGKLKDGAKGAQNLVQGAVTETVEQAGTRLVTKTGTVAQNIVTTSKNLKSLAFKNLAVTAGENVARAGINSIVDSVAQFSFEQIKDGITERVGNEIRDVFNARDFKHHLVRLYALDSVSNKPQLQPKVQKWVRDTTNPESDMWTSLWNSIGSPLTRGILSDPKYLGSTFSMATRAYGLINGMTQIATVVSKVCKHLESKIKSEEEAMSPAQIIRKHFTLTLQDSETVAKCIKFVDFKLTFQVLQFPSDSTLTSKVESMNGKASELEKLFKELYKSELSFDKDIECISKLRKTVTDAITTHIIHTANSQLVSPITTFAVGSLVANISQQLQAKYVLSEKDLSPEQLQDLKKAEELQQKDPSQLTPEERAFLSHQQRQSHTVRGYIEANASDHNIAYQQRAIIAKAEEIANSRASNTEQNISEDVVQDAVGVATIAPASISTIFLLAKANGVNLRIVHDPSYVPWEQELADGVQIMVYTKGEDGSPIGHYLLRDPKTGKLVDVPSERNDCGFAVLGQLTEKSVEKLRLEAAIFILENPQEYEAIRESSDWIIRERPERAAELLGVAGFRRCKECKTHHGDSPLPERTPEQVRQNLTNPIITREVDSKGRPVKIVAFITPQHMGTGTDTNDAVRDYVKMKAPGQQGLHAGHILGGRFGGIGNDTRNIAPQTPDFNQKIYPIMENAMAKYIEENNRPVLLELTLNYPDETSWVTSSIDFKYSSTEYSRYEKPTWKEIFSFSEDPYPTKYKDHGLISQGSLDENGFHAPPELYDINYEVVFGKNPQPSDYSDSTTISDGYFELD